MKKPFYKSPLFWSIAPLLLGVVLVVDLVQVAASAAWLEWRSRAMTPAERTAATAQMPAGTRVATAFGPAQTYKAKPGEWQVPQPDPTVLDSAPPQATVLPSKFGPNSETGRAGWGMRQETKAIGIGMPLRSLIMTAYKWQGSSSRMFLPDQIPTGQYDYIANLPTGSFEALQEEVKKKLGLVAARETRTMDSFVLRVKNTDAPGLKPTEGGSVASQGDQNITRYTQAPISVLVSHLEAVLGKPVIDQTGLTGRFDIRFPSLRRSGPGASPPSLEQSRLTILEHLGLDLIATNAPVEVLVVKKINP